MTKERSAASEREQQGVNGVEIGIRIANALADLPGPSHLREIAEAADLPASKTHRYLVSLCRAGLVRQEREDGRYDLAAGAIALGLAAQNRVDGFRLVNGVIDAIFDRTKLTVSVFAWGNRGPTVIRRIDGTGPVILTVRMGSVIPLVNTAAGRIFAAFLPPNIVQPFIDAELQAGIVSAASGKRITRKDFSRIVAAVREDGYAGLAGGFVAGSDAVSAPVFDASGQMLMAISVIYSPYSLPTREDPTELLLEACRDFSIALGYRGN